MSVSFRIKLTAWSYLILPDYIDLKMIHYVDVVEDLLKEGYKYEDGLSGINIERSELYKLCEERCLFGVPIAGRMKKTSELFGM